MATRSLPMQSQPVPTGVGIGTYDAYADAQRAVDFLSDSEFPVQYVTIVGNDLRMVERVTGRLTQNKVALGGAVGGAWWGLFIGTILILFGSGSGSGSEYSGYLLVLLTVLVGAVFGAVFALIGYAATRGRRDFTSTSSVVATSYEVLCQHAHADAARQLLGRLPVNR